MYGEAKKLHLIEAILKVEDDAVLKEVENILSKNNNNVSSRKSFKDFAGVLTDNEANEMEKIIEEGCEQINLDDWK
jgi:hypothetical protein